MARLVVLLRCCQRLSADLPWSSICHFSSSGDSLDPTVNTNSSTSECLLPAESIISEEKESLHPTELFDHDADYDPVQYVSPFSSLDQMRCVFRFDRRWSYEDQKSEFYVNFRNLQSWETIERVVDQLGPEFNENHATAALARLRHLPKPENLDFYDKLVDKIKLLIDGMPPRRQLLILSSSLRMEIDQTAFHEMIAQQLIKLESPVPIESSILSNAMLAVGVVYRHRAPEYQNNLIFPSQIEFVKKLIQWVDKENRIHEFREIECVRMLYMLSHMQPHLTPDRRLVSLLCAQLRRKDFISRMNELSIIGLVSSLTFLRHQDHSLLQMVVAEMLKVQSLSLYRNSELAFLSYCLGTLEYWNPEIYTMIFRELLQPDRKEQLSEMHLSNLIYGVSVHKGTPGFDRDQYLLPFLKEAAKEQRLKNYATVGVTNLLYNAGLTSYPKGKDARVFLPLLEELVYTSRLQTVSAQGLATAIWGIGKINLAERRALDCLAEEVMKKERLESFTSQGLSMIAYACGSMQYSNSHLMNALLQEMLKEERIPTFSNRNTSNFAFGIGRTNCGHPSLIHSFLKICLHEERLKSSETQQVCNVLRAASKLRILTGEELKTFIQEIAKPHRLNPLAPVELQEILLSFSTTPSLMRTSEAGQIMHKAFEKEMLRSLSEPQLCALCMTLSLFRDRFQAKDHELEHFAQEVVREQRLGRFSSIDLINIYTTSVRIGISEERYLVQMMKALCEKISKHYVTARDIILVIATTNFLQDDALRFRLLNKFIEIALSPECLDQFSPKEAFGVFNQLVKSRPSTESLQIWASILQRLVSISKKGDLLEVTEKQFLICLTHSLVLGDPILGQTGIGNLFLDMLHQEERTSQFSEYALIRCIVKVATMELSTEKKQREDVLKLLITTLHKRNSLRRVSEREAVMLMRVLEGTDVLTYSMREELLAATQGVKSLASHQNHTIAYSLEQMSGYLE